MEREKGFVQFFIILAVAVLALGFYLLQSSKSKSLIERVLPSPTPYQFPYKNPAVSKNRSYRIVVVGDSTMILGLNLLSLGSVEVQTSQSHAIMGTPVLVPVPRNVILSEG